jgi:hypothetical protein
MRKSHRQRSEFFSNRQFMYSGELRNIRFEYSGSSVESVAVRLIA